MPQAHVLAPDAAILSHAMGQEFEARKRKQLQDDAQAAALQQMLTGQSHQAGLAEQAQSRQGKQSLGALNQFLSTNPDLQERLGRRAEGPMPVGVAGPGSPTFNPYQASGAGAGVLADFVKGEMSNASAESRAQAAQEATLRNLILKGGMDRENLQFTEGNKDRRLDVTEGGQNERFYQGEAGKDRRFSVGEQGKNARSAGRDAAIAGETTYRAQLAQMDDYMKRLDAARSAATLEKFMAAKDPARSAAASLKLQQIEQQLQQAQAQYNQMLQPRGPAVTAPAAPQAPAQGGVERWDFVNGKLQRVQ